jgi:hypothetical protein
MDIPACAAIRSASSGGVERGDILARVNRIALSVDVSGRSPPLNLRKRAAIKRAVPAPARFFDAPDPIPAPYGRFLFGSARNSAD